ncbi:TRAM domain protein (plasmid) [Natronomonas pharaonis DSM 2160]|uniref:TRAM domain protein n=1 Tax=Natronomonas pharaonis (strain ATCC 35678 / DSM 2160 / CIP 103997 / JCM 8858 / NBRC 14720 / NCIMB 2260 / Gabara) TaxID=348780 RepID=Q3ILX6_NATPD|nr:TRAM domain-containing protein [Natronomonas pharaonis]CAI50894.1 TRAM domain protein [Natronomonas pharaonis DSM 2160]
MTEIPDPLRTLYSASIEKQDGTYTIEVPLQEIEHGAVEPGETYRIAILESTETDTSSQQPSRPAPAPTADADEPTGPPVDEGEIREVTVETVGDQGDGIAKVERGYVIIVPDAAPGDEPTVEIQQVRENVAFADVVGHE